MGNMKFLFVFGFEWWGKLRPAETTTQKGQRLVPLFLGIWLRFPRTASMSQQEKVSVESETQASQFSIDMLLAFRHGREFEQVDSDCDFINHETPDKNLPFSEWFHKHFAETEAAQPPR